MFRRFVAAPYKLIVPHSQNDMCIRSNDLEIALARRRYLSDREKNNAYVRNWKVIRGSTSPVDSKGIFFFENGSLRTLHAGEGTIPAYDRDSQEVLGFPVPDVKAEQLVASLLPALIGKMATETVGDLLQKSDKQHIAE